MGIHGSLAIVEHEYAKDADYIVMLKKVMEPVGTDANVKKISGNITTAICKILNGRVHNKYVCENLNLIGHSIIIKENIKLSFHFVSLDNCKKSIKSLLCPEQKIDCIFSTEIFPTRIYRLWIRDTIELFDKNRCLAEMKKIDVNNYHLLMRPYIMEHLTSSINQYGGCIDRTACYLLKQSVINAAVLLIYALNHVFFGSPKKLFKDLNDFEIEKNTSQIIKKLFKHPDSDNLISELILSMQIAIAKIQNGTL